MKPIDNLRTLRSHGLVTVTPERGAALRAGRGTNPPPLSTYRMTVAASMSAAKSAGDPDLNTAPLRLENEAFSVM